MSEEWRDIEGYEDIYQVSNFGRVKSLTRLGSNNRIFYGTVRKPVIDKNCYCIVTLCKDGKTKNQFIHRLVAQAFLPNIDNLPVVNHKDENKQNNCVDNLEWCTVKYNTNYGTSIERRKDKRRGIKMNKEIVSRIAEKHKKPVGMFKDGTFIRKFDSATDAVKENNNFKIMSISAACNGRIKTYRGFEWKFM